MSPRDELYQTAVRDYGRALDRLAAGYEADPEKRHDLRQEIHLQLWRSLELFDSRCSLKTWAFRVAHNTAVTYVTREHRRNAPLAGLEEVERTVRAVDTPPDIDRKRALARLHALIHRLKPMDRQIIICYLEGLDGASIAEITGLSPANIGVKIHRIKNILTAQFQEEKRYA